MKEPSEEEYRKFVAKVEALPRSSKAWVLPIYRALAESGGGGKPRDIEKHIREQTKHILTREQWAYALKSKSIRFARNELRKLGGIDAATSGLWQWTPVGRRYWKDHEGELLIVPEGLPALSPEESEGVDEPLVTVEVTTREGYDIPVLRVLSHGPCRRAEVFEKLETLGGLPLLPGDRRLTRQQNPVFMRGGGWTLSHLKSEGLVRNPSHGMWEITDAGRDVLKRDGDTWSADLFRGAQARVRPLVSSQGAEKPAAQEVTMADATSAEEDRARPKWDAERWRGCKSKISTAAYAAAHHRLRPDLGPTPDTLRTPIPRNLILYGPPGTGKTYTASKIATALTGEPEPSDDGLFRILQFHPSYAYEDFVQGLRPDLTRSGIHYRVDPGPLRRVCDQAVED
ncbi:MAG TPA: AAA family ATPase, partial [Nannocystis exedens]|nr:AAA family ATPase [Nannocystis exedens]